MAKKKGRDLLATVFIILIIMLIVIFTSKEFIAALFADAISPIWQEDLLAIIQTGGLLLIMVGAPAIIVIIILGICKIGTALSDAVLGEDEDDCDKDSKTQRIFKTPRRATKSK